MWKKLAVSAACGAAIIGAGGAALAATGSSSSAVSSNVAPTTTSSSAPTGGHQKGALIKRIAAVQHATWVTKDKDAFVTHDAVHGTVTAVSATSVTVKSADNVSETYAVTSSTKVRVRTAGTAKGKDGSIADVKTGQIALVTGTGTTTLTAEHIVTGLKK